jgi:hypothetical protein
VKFQIEEHAIAAIHERAYQVGSRRREQLAANLEPANDPSESIGQAGRFACRWNVERD